MDQVCKLRIEGYTTEPREMSLQLAEGETKVYFTEEEAEDFATAFIAMMVDVWPGVEKEMERMAAQKKAESN